MDFPILNFKCPQCGRTHVHPTEKILGTSGASVPVGKHGLRFSDSSVKTMSVWRCDDCGFEFRDVNSWYQQLQNEKYSLDHPFTFIKICIYILIYVLPLSVLSIPAMILLMVFENITMFLLIVYTVLFVLVARHIHKLRRANYETAMVELMELAKRCNADYYE